MPVTRGPPARLQRRAARAAQSNHVSDIHALRFAAHMHTRQSAYHSHQRLGPHGTSLYNHESRLDASELLTHLFFALLHHLLPHLEGGDPPVHA